MKRDSAAADLAIHPPLVAEILTRFIRNEIERTGFRRAVFGLSGGIDSSVVAYLVVQAMGPENVLAVTMPYATSSEETRRDSEAVIAALGMQSLNVPITPQVDAYNAACAQGEDTRFHKPAKFLLPVGTPPFYAVKMETGIMITMGGIRIDDHMRCLDKAGHPIPGLYSVGCDAGGLFGESYSLPIPGSANGFALTSGWLTADDIAERIQAGAL